MQIYIHIPFCELKCKYCRFASIWQSQNLHINKYVSFLCKEIERVPVPFKTFKEVISTIYFGWWTPSVLSEENFKQIFKALRQKFIFSKDIEITIESTPNNITQKNLEIWQSLWINRISIWIQTLNYKSLKEINRWNKWDIEKALGILNSHSKSISSHPNFFLKDGEQRQNNLNINLDFIIWLPYVKKWEILENIKYVLEKYDFIKHISVYMLEEYYSPDKVIETKFDNIIYPKDWKNLWIKDEDYLEEYLNIKKYLLEKWFVNYEISNFAKVSPLPTPLLKEREQGQEYSDYRCRHNMWYWEHKEVLGFWMGAYWLKKIEIGTGIHFIQDGYRYLRYANADNFKDYYEQKKIFEEKLSQDDIFIEKLMFGLRTNWLEKEIYEKLDKNKINYFIENWYLKEKSDKIMLSDKWVLVLDYILTEIL